MTRSDALSEYPLRKNHLSIFVARYFVLALCHHSFVAWEANAMTMKSKRLVVCTLTVALGAATTLLAAEHASASTVFDVTGTFTDASTISGSLTIDVTAGHVDAVNVTYLGVNYTNILVQGTGFGSTAPGQIPVPIYYGVITGIPYPFIDLAFRGTSAVNSLVGYVGGALCSVDAPCGPDEQGFFWVGDYRTSNTSAIGLQTGELTAETPLPAALPLFASGLGALGLLGSRRKKKAPALAA